MSQEKRTRILDSLPANTRTAIGPMLDAVFEYKLVTTEHSFHAHPIHLVPPATQTL
jgi:hypothetical protein